MFACDIDINKTLKQKIQKQKIPKNKRNNIRMGLEKFVSYKPDTKTVFIVNKTFFYCEVD